MYECTIIYKFVNVYLAVYNLNMYNVYCICRGILFLKNESLPISELKEKISRSPSQTIPQLHIKGLNFVRVEALCVIRQTLLDSVQGGNLLPHQLYLYPILRYPIFLS